MRRVATSGLVVGKGLFCGRLPIRLEGQLPGGAGVRRMVTEGIENPLLRFAREADRKGIGDVAKL